MGRSVAEKRSTDASARLELQRAAHRRDGQDEVRVSVVWFKVHVWSKKKKLTVFFFSSSVDRCCWTGCSRWCSSTGCHTRRCSWRPTTLTGICVCVRGPRRALCSSWASQVRREEREAEKKEKKKKRKKRKKEKESVSLTSPSPLSAAGGEQV